MHVRVHVQMPVSLHFVIVTQRWCLQGWYDLTSLTLLSTTCKIMWVVLEATVQWTCGFSWDYRPIESSSQVAYWCGWGYGDGP